MVGPAGAAKAASPSITVSPSRWARRLAATIGPVKKRGSGGWLPAGNHKYSSKLPSPVGIGEKLLVSVPSAATNTRMPPAPPAIEAQ